MTLDAIEDPQLLGRGLGIVPGREEPQAPDSVLVDQRPQRGVDVLKVSTHW